MKFYLAPFFIISISIILHCLNFRLKVEINKCISSIYLFHLYGSNKLILKPLYIPTGSARKLHVFVHSKQRLLKNIE